MRKFIVALALLVGVVFIIGRLSEVEAIAATLQRGDWRFIGLAFLFLGGWLLTNGAIYRAIFCSLEIEEELRVLVPLSASIFFLNVIAPTAGVSGIALLVAEARKRGFSPARAAVANALFTEFDYFGVLSTVAVGLLVLFRRNNINGAEITAAALLLIAAVTFGTLLVLGMRSADELGRALDWLARLVNVILNPFIHRPYISEAYAFTFARDAAEGLLNLRHHPRLLIRPAVLAVISKGLLFLILVCVFLAFQIPISIGTLVASFSIGLLFLVVSPTPAGLGFVEGTLTLMLTSMYIPLANALIITMAYRGISFWVPLLIGMLAFNFTNRQSKAQATTRS